MVTKIKRLTSHRDIYDWVKWSDGSAYRAEKGRDFACTATSFKAAVFGYARRHGLKARVAVSGDAVDFRFVRPARRSRKSR